MRLLLVLVPGLVGCVGKPIHPRTDLWQRGDGQVVLGATLEAFGSWAATCKVGSILDKDERDSQPCEEKPVKMEVSCEGPCRLINRSRGDTLGLTQVVPQALGRLVVHIVNTRVDTQQVDGKSFALIVVKPTKLALQCLSPAGSYALCGPDGVAAANPVVRPDVFLGDRRVRNVFLQINQQTREIRDGAPPLSLAELFPDAREGDGVKPGTYTIELELAGLSERYQLVAQ
jgi:hypothetical protein